MAHQEEPNPDYRKGFTDVSGDHSPHVREKGDPKAGGEIPPLSVFAVAGVIFMTAGGVLVGHNKANDEYKLVDQRPMTADAIDTRTPAEIAFDNGKKQYAVCMGCHQSSGVGIPGQFPPLAGSEWVTGGSERLAMMVMHGLTGPVKVKGSLYNTPGGMIAQGALLTDQKLADVLTYIRNEWGNSASPVTKEQITALREKYADRTTQWTIAEIESVVPDGSADLPGGPEEPGTE